MFAGILDPHIRDNPPTANVEVNCASDLSYSVLPNSSAELALTQTVYLGR